MAKPSNTSITAYDKSLQLLSYKNYSSFELRKKLLQFNFIDQQISEAIQKCIDLKLLNDDETMKYYIENCQVEKKWGYRKIVSKLQEKNIPADQIKFFMKEYYRRDLEPDIKELLLKEKEEKLSDTMDIYKKKGILARFLNQRGF